ncbi:MAG: leucyl aminopeptidase family protein, partial [Polyangiaceae bacterium]|nr:leucyl aminopeptidase family protein [Polyangiaceae bacterium]
AKGGRLLHVPDAEGNLEFVLLAVAKGFESTWSYAHAAATLPARSYYIDGALSAEQADRAALGWSLGSYRYERYKRAEGELPELAWPETADRSKVRATAAATFLVRDLVTTPANDMGPAELAAAARDLAKAHGAKITVITGEQLIEKGYPLVHAVGRGSSRAPRMIDLRWGKKGPEVVLVGKGVCFDSGGLDLKPASAMKLMKKDMGGAAHALGVASMVMSLDLPVRLRVLIPAVENSVSGDAFRPMDVFRSRKGLTVEIGNTDAEGRLVLCDALTAAGKPDLLIDFATLTGAARVALGTDIPVLFSNDDDVAEKLLGHGKSAGDPLWRLPLAKSYKSQLKSAIADLNNVSDNPYGGAITAALFLEEFVEKGV